MSSDSRLANAARVGTLILSALILLMIGTFFIGEQNNLFRPKNRYSIRFHTVSGLATGNPVQLNGINVGQVTRVVLHEEIRTEKVTVEIAVDRRFASRVRGDSEARIRTMGLLGDKFVEITSGSPDAPVVPPGGEIPAEEPTNVDELIASGEDVMENVVTISHSLASILGRVDRGERVLGELVSDPGKGEKITATLSETLESMRNIAQDLDSGEGPLGALLKDRELRHNLTSSARHLESILQEVHQGAGILPALLNNAESRQDLEASMASLRRATESLEELGARLRRDDGLLFKLTGDPELAEVFSRELLDILTNLSELSEKLNQGDGTISRLVNDPSLYEAAEDIVVGVEESRLLRWLIRNRQKAGIEKRYDEARAAEASQSAEETPDDDEGGQEQEEIER